MTALSCSLVSRLDLLQNRIQSDSLLDFPRSRLWLRGIETLGRWGLGEPGGFLVPSRFRLSVDSPPSSRTCGWLSPDHNILCTSQGAVMVFARREHSSMRFLLCRYRSFCCGRMMVSPSATLRASSR